MGASYLCMPAKIEKEKVAGLELLPPKQTCTFAVPSFSSAFYLRNWAQQGPFSAQEIDWKQIIWTYKVLSLLCPFLSPRASQWLSVNSSQIIEQKEPQPRGLAFERVSSGSWALYLHDPFLQIATVAHHALFSSDIFPIRELFLQEPYTKIQELFTTFREIFFEPT